MPRRKYRRYLCSRVVGRDISCRAFEILLKLKEKKNAFKKFARLRISVFDLACEKLSWVFLACMLIVRGLDDIHIHVDTLNGTCRYSSTLHHYLLT